MKINDVYEFLKTEEFKLMEKEILESYNKTEELFKKLRETYPLDQDYFWMIMGVGDPKVFPAYCPIVEEYSIYA